MLKGEWGMKDYIEKRAILLANYIIENKATVRCAAKEFLVSKSTVHKDVTERLKEFSPLLYEKTKLVLEENKEQRHIRGGIATREKYKNLKEEKNAAL